MGWKQGDIVITMSFDRLGRRVHYVETRGGQHYMNAKYVYEGYLCIQRLYGATNRVYQRFVWDPTEPIATRPLVMKVADWKVTTSYTYSNVGEQTALTQTVGEEWRKQQSEAEYLLRDGNVWRKQTAVQSCSDEDIAPLTQTAYAQLSGLSVTNTFNQITVDIRGNETRTFGNDTQRTTQVPSCSNPQIERYAFGQLVETVDTACVTNRFEYDALDRRIASIDGRNNRTVSAYDAKGDLVSATDAVGAVTAYGYDVMGQTVAVTNALGNVMVYQYDLRGNKTYEGGATYPVRYTYDVFGNKTTMTTYRDEASGVGDTTTWTYDEASGLLLAKTYADGKGLAYTYTNDGRLATRTNARGIVTTYSYDIWGQLLSIDYADTTPDIAYTYDAMGRPTSATDAVGTTTFTYDAFGQRTAEQVSGLYSKALTRHYDTYGRNVGYSVDGERKQSITYDSATGRIAESDGFAWDYLAGSNLKSQLIYPNEAVVTWTYEPHRDLLTAVTNATYSTYVYTNDFLGRRTSKNDEQYGYNVRNELTSANDVSYAYDDIGNRTTAESKTYTANNLNQYTAIDDFVPQYDDDGNQTLIKTETGVWSVLYNAENRPVRWQSGDTVITMAFDRMGRRVEMQTMKDGVETLQRFVYDNYLCIQQLRGADNTLAQSYVWDPTEPIATRPLESRSLSNDIIYYFHDGNKNVTDLVIHSTPIVHYDYTPFGSVNQTFLSPSQSIENPFKFSSEYFDDTLGLVYYNNRHYTPLQGRFLRRDIVSDYVLQEYAMGMNNPVGFYDYVGYTSISVSHSIPLGPIPIPPLHVSLVGEVIFSGKFENCKLCNGTTPEIHFFTETSVSAKVGIRAGVAFNDGINRNGQFVHQGGKNDAKNRYRDLSGRFAKRPSTDTLKDILGLELWNQSIMPASLEDWEQLPQCPQDSISGSLSIYVQGRASVLGLGANVDLTWQLLPSDGRSWWPTFEGRKGFIGGGTALYVEAGITGTLSLTAVY